MPFIHNTIEPTKVHQTLAKHLLVDGFPVVIDLEKSHGSFLHCSKTNKEYLDFFSFFASNPLGFNHPVMHQPEVEKRLLEAARVKVSNSDKYTTYFAEFVDTLERTAGVPELPHYFFIEGGTLGVENAMKVAFDWKARRNKRGNSKANDLQIMHFRNAFHGRSGYTLSTTNTDINKTNLFPKFDWPRIDAPALHFPLTKDVIKSTIEKEAAAVREIERYFDKSDGYIAGILIETIQAEGGDNHFRPEFFAQLRALADRYDALLIYDEVQAGMGSTGRWWAYQHHDIKPDILIFGKKMQVGGIMVSNRIDNVEDNCFKKSSRINSTFGGNLVDFVRATAILETIVNENLLENAACRGAQLLGGLEELEKEFSWLSNARGKGLMIAVDTPNTEIRNTILNKCFEEQHFIALPCGTKSIRFRPTLTVSENEVFDGLDRFRQVLKSVQL